MYTWGENGLDMAPDYASDLERDNARFQQEMARLRMSNQYNLSGIEERAKMEAQLIALKEGYLPRDMAGSLLGIDPMASTRAQPGQDSIYPELLGGIAGGIAGSKFSPQMSAGLGKAATAVGNMKPLGTYADDALWAASRATRGMSADFMNNTKVNNKGLSKLVQGLGTAGVDTSVGMNNLGLSLAGKGGMSKLAKLLGGTAKFAGKFGGVPGTLAGIAVGSLIEELLDGDEEEKARKRYLASL
jgi:hypothetical protein